MLISWSFLGIYGKSTNHWRTAPPRHAVFPPAGKSRLNHNSVICWFTLTLYISNEWKTSIISSSQNCVLLHCFHFPSEKHPTKIIQHHINNKEFSIVFSVASNCSFSETCSNNQEPPRSDCLQLTKVNQLIIIGHLREVDKSLNNRTSSTRCLSSCREIPA